MRTIDVVAGVIFDEARTSVLLSLRRADRHQGGLWEFPGGKVEVGEERVVALGRELEEELGIVVRETATRCSLEHAYGDRTVRLHVFDVLGFEGEPRGREGQEVRWVGVAELGGVDFPEANRKVVAGLVSGVTG